jgi:menaquinone-dependent protoporphyrinogen oxidase
MSKRVLVAYATRAGSTIEVAGAVADSLRERGFEVDVEGVKAEPSVAGYDAVVIGSAIRFGGWLPEAIYFIRANQKALRKLPVAIFTVHILNLGDDEDSRSNREAYLSAVRPLVAPVAEAFFAGKGDLARLNIFERKIFEVVGAPVGDLRDWKKVRGWAEEILETGEKDEDTTHDQLADNADRGPAAAGGKRRRRRQPPGR